MLCPPIPPSLYFSCFVLFFSSKMLSVSQAASSPAVSLVYSVRNGTVFLNGTIASNLLGQLSAELVGYFLFYPPLVIAERKLQFAFRKMSVRQDLFSRLTSRDARSNYCDHLGGDLFSIRKIGGKCFVQMLKPTRESINICYAVLKKTHSALLGVFDLENSIYQLFPVIGCLRPISCVL